jgi:formylglycine-generating enzyme required for sulfatase activity
MGAKCRSGDRCRASNAIIVTGLPWRVRDNASNIEMLLVPPGTFTMGCSASSSHACFPDESPLHQVTLSAFYMGRYEVTQAQWLTEMGSNPSNFQGASYPDAASRPVEMVSWNMIQPFCTQNSLRLPTEAEREYAYRAGTTTAFHSMGPFPNGTNDDTMVGNIGAIVDRHIWRRQSWTGTFRSAPDEVAGA